MSPYNSTDPESPIASLAYLRSTRPHMTATEYDAALETSRQSARNSDTFDSALTSGHAALSFYEENNEMVDEAFGALSGLAANELAQQSAGALLAVAKKVVSALACVQQIHPAISLVVLTFHGFVSLELKRRENDQRVAALVAQASSAMVEFLQLRNLVDVEVLAPNGDVLQGPLQACLARTVDVIKDCGNAVDKYYKSKTIARYIKSSQWEEKFVQFAQTFVTVKQDIQSAVMGRTAVRVEHSIAQMTRVQLKLDSIIDLLRTPTSAEERFLQELRRLGGQEACLRDDINFSALAASCSGQRFASQDLRTLLAEARAPLETQLRENRRLYELKLEAMTAAISNRMQEIVDGAEDRLLRELRRDDPHRKVKDLHLRHLWKAEHWAFSVKSSYFIPALHDYFENQFRGHPARTPRRSLFGQRPGGPPSPALSALSGSVLTSLDDDDDRPPLVSLADEWCLNYLNVSSFPSLKDAFDGDANGLVSTREVNAFCSALAMPPQWTLLQRLAFAAAGFSIEMCRYRDRILALLNEILYLSLEVLPENRGLVCAYLDSEAILRMRQICLGVNEVVASIDIELGILVEERMSIREDKLQRRLLKSAYEIPTPDFVGLVLDKGRVEHYLAPLLYVLLLRHAEIVKLSKQAVLDRRELELASTSIMHVIETALNRITRLADSFKRKGEDPSKRFATFANGIYSRLFENAPCMDDVSYWRTHSQDTVDMGIVLQNLAASDLRYSIPEPLRDTYACRWQDSHPRISASITGRSRLRAAAMIVLQDIRRTCLSNVPLRSAQMKQYIRIAPLSILQSMSSARGPPHLVFPASQIFQHLKDMLSPQDRAYCDAVADLHVRRSTVIHTSIRCSGCRAEPLVHDRYQCLDCLDVDYHLCQNCVGRPTEQHRDPHPAHTPNHSMILFATEVCKFWNAVTRQRGLEQLHLSIPRTTSADGTLALGIDGRLFCDECGWDLPDSFYCCLTCPDINGYCCLCERCAGQDEFMAALGHSRSNHYMVFIRDRNAPGIAGPRLPLSADATAETTMRLQLSIDDVNGRLDDMSALVDTMSTRMDGMVVQMEKMMQMLEHLVARVPT